MNLEKIKTLLIDITQFEIIKIIDNSSSHSNHVGVTNELTHNSYSYKIKIQII